MSIKKVLFYLIGFGLFIYILSLVDLSKTIEILYSSNVYLFMFSLFLYLPVLILKSFKWDYILKVQNFRISFFHIFTTYAIGTFFGIITPGRIGDFVKIFYLNKKDFPFGSSTFSVIFDRLSDMFILSIFALFGLFFIFPFFFHSVYLFIFVFLLILVISYLLYVNGMFSKILKLLYYFFVPEKHKQTVKDGFTDFVSSFRIFTFKRYILLFFISLIVWLFYYLQTYLLALSLGINLSYFYVAIMLSLSGLISLLPVTISGLGTRDAVFILFFSYFGLTKEQAVAYSFSIFLLFLFAAFVGFLIWLKIHKFSNFSKPIINQ